MNEDTRDRFFFAIEEAAECESHAKLVAKKAKFLQERMRELMKELDEPTKGK